MFTLTKETAAGDSSKHFVSKLVAENKVDGEPHETAGECVWQQNGYFGAVRTDYNMEKANFPENSLFYVNQAYLTIQKSKKIYNADYFLLGQIIEAMNPPNDIKNYKVKNPEVKHLRPKYNPETGEFLGISETIGFLVVRGDPFEVFLNYGYNLEKSKILYSTFRKKNPSSFCGTMFNRQKQLVESGEVDLKMSQLLFYLPSITDRSEEINQYLKNVNISPFDVTQKQLDIWAGLTFMPNKLEMSDLETSKMEQAVVKSLEHTPGVSNTNLVCNTDGLLCRKSSSSEVECVDGVKRVIPEKYKISY